MNHKPNYLGRQAVFLGAFCLSLSSVTAPQLDGGGKVNPVESRETEERHEVDTADSGTSGSLFEKIKQEAMTGCMPHVNPPLPSASLVNGEVCWAGGGFPFSIMEDTKKVKFNPKAPEWRRISPGLNLEGTCENKPCKAYRKRAWAKKGFVRGLDLGREKSFCPICSERLKKVSNSAFYKCHYQVNGELASGDEEEVERSGTDYGKDGFTTFNESTTGYKWITITTTSL